jgi:hypothetical protein
MFLNFFLLHRNKLFPALRSTIAQARQRAKDACLRSQTAGAR